MRVLSWPWPRRSAGDALRLGALATRIAVAVIAAAVVPVVLGVMAVFVSFVHHVMQSLKSALDVLAFAGVQKAVARAKVEFPLPNLPQLSHEVASFLAGVRPVAKAMPDALKVMLIEFVEALITAEILTILTLVLVLMFVRLRHGRSPDRADGRGGEKNTQKLFHRADPLLNGQDGRSNTTSHTH